MRIKGNIFKSGIIHIENCIGRLANTKNVNILANTYIENYDHFFVSAITVTSACQGQKCFPFEVTKTQLYGKIIIFSTTNY